MLKILCENLTVPIMTIGLINKIVEETIHLLLDKRFLDDFQKLGDCSIGNRVELKNRNSFCSQVPKLFAPRVSTKTSKCVQIDEPESYGFKLIDT